ncbi:MAG: hypothetical protein ACI4DX_06545 [Oliverpabstia sp.]
MKDENGISDTNSLLSETENAYKVPIGADRMPINGLSAQQKIILQCVEEKGQITSHHTELLLKVKQRRVRIILEEMVDLGVLERQDSYRSMVYVLNEGRKK